MAPPSGRARIAFSPTGRPACLLARLLATPGGKARHRAARRPGQANNVTIITPRLARNGSIHGAAVGRSWMDLAERRLRPFGQILRGLARARAIDLLCGSARPLERLQSQILLYLLHDFGLQAAASAILAARILLRAAAARRNPSSFARARRSRDPIMDWRLKILSSLLEMLESTPTSATPPR